MSDKAKLAGSYLAKRGFAFERKLAEAYVQSSRPKKFREMCDRMDAVASRKYQGRKIAKIKQCKVERTPDGGAPKADMSFRYDFADGTQGRCSFSLKVSTASRVSVHQCTVQQFLDGIGIAGDAAAFKTIKNGMNLFNECGSWKKVKSLPSDDQNKLKSALSGAETGIAKYVMSTGNGGTASDAVIIVNPKKGLYNIAADLDYVESCRKHLLNAKKGRKGFSGVFTYTYPHKKRGQQIQVKMPVVLCYRISD